MKDLLVSRVSTTSPQIVGRIHGSGTLFSYDEAYLASRSDAPFSLSNASTVARHSLRIASLSSACTKRTCARPSE